MGINERLIELCQKKGLPRSRVEKELGLSNGYIKKTKSPSAEKLKLLADYFGVSQEYLIGEEERFDVEDAADHAKIIRTYNRLCQADKDIVMGIIDLFANKKE